MRIHNPEIPEEPTNDVSEIEVDPSQLIRDLIKSRLTNTEIIEELETPLPSRNNVENDQ